MERNKDPGSRILVTGRTMIRPLADNESDLRLVYGWRNSSDYRKWCSVRKKEVTYEEFREEIYTDFSRDRHWQYLIYRRLQGTDIPVGTIFSYALNEHDGYVFLTTYLEPKHRFMGIGLESTAMVIAELIERYKLFKIYLDVYSTNLDCLKILDKFGAIKEAELKGHRVDEGKRYDLCRFALFEEHITQIVDRLKFLNRNPERR